MGAAGGAGVSFRAAFTWKRALTLFIVIAFAIFVTLSWRSRYDWETPPTAYKNPLDGIASVFRIGRIPCAHEEVVDGSKMIAFSPTDDCYKMEPAKRFRGIWLDQFEGSSFFEGISDPAIAEAQMKKAMNEPPGPSGEWLTFPENSKYSSPPPRARWVRVDFVGRRTAYPGSYGHMGMSRTEVLVDRLIAFKPLYESKFGYIECEFPNSPVRCE